MHKGHVNSKLCTITSPSGWRHTAMNMHQSLISFPKPAGYHRARSIQCQLPKWDRREQIVGISFVTGGDFCRPGQLKRRGTGQRECQNSGGLCGASFVIPDGNINSLHSSGIWWLCVAHCSTILGDRGWPLTRHQLVTDTKLGVLRWVC